MFELSDWKPLIKITEPILASLLEGRLQAEGIPVILRTGEAAGSLYGLTTGPLAEITVLVPQARFAEALALMQQIDEEQVVEEEMD